MIEPLTLGAIVAALVSKAMGRAEDRAVGAAEGMLPRAVENLKQYFSDTHEEAASTALERLEDVPDSPGLRRDLARLLDERAAVSPEFRQELEALVKEARAAGIEIGSIDQAASGDRNVQIAVVTDSDVRVSFGGREGKDRPSGTDD